MKIYFLKRKKKVGRSRVGEWGNSENVIECDAVRGRTGTGRSHH